MRKEKFIGYTSPSKDELLASIRPNMHLTKDFIKRIYGYESSYSGFAEQAIAALEVAGCSKARQYYTDWINEYETVRNLELKEVAHWYRLECEREWARKQIGGEEKRTEDVEIELLTRKRRLLMRKLQI